MQSPRVVPRVVSTSLLAHVFGCMSVCRKQENRKKNSDQVYVSSGT